MLQGFIAAMCVFAAAATIGKVSCAGAARFCRCSVHVCGSSYNLKSWLKLQGFVAVMCVFAAAATTGKVG